MPSAVVSDACSRAQALSPHKPINTPPKRGTGPWLWACPQLQLDVELRYRKGPCSTDALSQWLTCLYVYQYDDGASLHRTRLPTHLHHITLIHRSLNIPHHDRRRVQPRNCPSPLSLPHRPPHLLHPSQRRHRFRLVHTRPTSSGPPPIPLLHHPLSPTRQYHPPPLLLPLNPLDRRQQRRCHHAHFTSGHETSADELFLWFR